MTQFLQVIGVLFPFLLLSVFFVALIGILVAQRRWQHRGSPSLKGSLRRFKVSLALLAIYLGIAAVTVQTLTTGLNSFGYPDVLADVQTTEQILDYLQRYNRAIMTNTYALLWFFYAFVVWFLTTLYAFAQAVVKAILAHPHS